MLLIVFATGCVGQRDPTGYGDSVRKNFVEGCTAGWNPEGKEKDPEAAGHHKLCTCLYDQLSDKKTGIPFDDFKSAQSKIRENPTNPANTIDKLIPEFKTYEATCKSKVVAGPS